MNCPPFHANGVRVLIISSRLKRMFLGTCLLRIKALHNNDFIVDQLEEASNPTSSSRLETKSIVEGKYLNNANEYKTLTKA